MLIAEFNFSGMIIDYNDLYFRAVKDYFMVLEGKEKDIGYEYKNTIPKEFTDVYTGKSHKMETGKISNDINRPIIQRCYSSTLAFPILIEKILTANIYKKRLAELLEGVDNLLFYKVIKLTESEKILYNIIKTPRK